MAITDDNFTAEELTAVVGKKPDLLKVISSAFEPAGHRFIPKDEYNSFLDGERGRIASEKTSEIYSQLDKDIFEATGIAKAGPEEKTYEYNKRAFATLKQTKGSLEDQIKTLKDQIAAGSSDKTLKDQLAAAQAKLEGYDKTEIPKYQRQLFEKDVQIQIASAIPKLKFKADYPEVLLKPAIAAITGELVQGAKTEGNGIVFIGADGKTILDDKLQVATAEYILRERLKDLLDDGRQQGGGGTGAPGAGVKTGIKNKEGREIEIPADLKTKRAVHEFLVAQGLTPDSKEFNELFTKHAVEKNLPLR